MTTTPTVDGLEQILALETEAATLRSNADRLAASTRYEGHYAKQQRRRQVTELRDRASAIDAEIERLRAQQVCGERIPEESSILPGSDHRSAPANPETAAS